MLQNEKSNLLNGFTAEHQNSKCSDPDQIAETGMIPGGRAESSSTPHSERMYQQPHSEPGAAECVGC